MIRTNKTLLPEWSRLSVGNPWERVQRTGFGSQEEVKRELLQAFGKRHWQFDVRDTGYCLSWTFDSEETERIAKPILVKAFGEHGE